jgi:hypothetical protein
MFLDDKVRVIRNGEHVFVCINDADENLKDYLKPGLKLDMGKISCGQIYTCLLLVVFQSFDYPFGLDMFEDDDHIPDFEELLKRHTVRSHFAIYLFISLGDRGL